MRRSHTLVLGISSVVFVLGAFFGPVALRRTLPPFTVTYLEADSENQEQMRVLPFFGLMVPIPHQEEFTFLPRLEYRPGPPNRYLSKISYLLVEKNREQHERIDFYGRRTLDDWLIKAAQRFTSRENWSYANFLEASLRFAQNGQWPREMQSNWPIVARWLFYLQARRFLGDESKNVYVLNQADIPAFLAVSSHRSSIGERARALFFKRNALHEIAFSSDGSFNHIDPVAIFRRSFLLETRQDALAYLARELSQVQLNTQKLSALSFEEFEWPLLLLGAKLSIDPSSIHAFFHFAGLNALLFREHGKSTENLTVVDSIRNNVLVSERYGSDVAPDSEQAAEMSRLARALVKIL